MEDEPHPLDTVSAWIGRRVRVEDDCDDGDAVVLAVDDTAYAPSAWVKFADEIGLYVQAEPLVAKAISALVAKGDEQSVIDATVFAWQQYDKARQNGSAAASLAVAQQQEIKLEAADQVRKEAVDQARKDAGIPGTSAGGVHETTGAQVDQNEIEAAAQAMRAYGSTPGNPGAAKWRELTIGRTLPREIFG